jgi:glucuronate isomerase
MSFINEDFMLSNDFARELYHGSAEGMPIIDYHCHLSPQEMAGTTTNGAPCEPTACPRII